MTSEPSPAPRPPLLEQSGLPQLARIPILAIRADNLAIGLAAVFASLVFGTVLDWVASIRGGVAPTAVAQFILTRQLDQPYVEPSGNVGVFHVWRDHQKRCVVSLLMSFLPGKSYVRSTMLGDYLDAHSKTGLPAALSDMAYGVWWLIRAHPIYSLFLLVGLAVIWTVAGGAICRIAAMQLARDDLLTLRQGVEFSLGKLWQGFVTALGVPLGLCLVVVFLMILGGVVLRIPWLGDVVGGAAFPLALLGGVVVAGLLVGLLTGGHLFCPAVAWEACDGFEAFSRGFSYVFTRPWKTLWYAAFSLFYAAVSWLIVNLAVLFALSVTRNVISFGTSPFGWWKRVGGDVPRSKLEVLWPLGESYELYRAPDWSTLGFFEYIPAVLIGFWVLLVILSMWGFLASFYFTACTVSYCLLRRDVDGTDVDEVRSDDVEEDDTGWKPASSAAASGAPAATPLGGTSAQ